MATELTVEYRQHAGIVADDLAASARWTRSAMATELTVEYRQLAGIVADDGDLQMFFDATILTVRSILRREKLFEAVCVLAYQPNCDRRHLG